MGNDGFQFYPTPVSLAKRAWEKFKNRKFHRVLEPSAGNGDLAKSDDDGYFRSRSTAIDAIEIDISKHPALAGKGLNVVGFDFLKFKAGAIYSHCIMNPPFAEGAKHVLHAWDILEDAEIVAILNAETIRNPYSSERRLLVSLIEKHGEVEFISEAFSSQEAERKTDVEIALVWLRKESASGLMDIIGDITDRLKKDEEVGLPFEEMNQVALPDSMIENAVRAYRAAELAIREAVVAQARANYYRSIIGATYTVVRGEEEKPAQSLESSREFVRRNLAEGIDDIKDRAWTSILTSTQVTTRLSSRAQKRLEAEFENIKKLEFSQENIYGFLLGLVEKQGEIQLAMVCDVFDEITKYHEDNTVWYMGWKSNSKHRTCGMRIKTTRFVIPGHSTESWRQGLDWDSRKQLGDFDKVFAMLDGKTEPGFGLNDAFSTCFNQLRNGERVSTSYFDVRYYPGRGTIHFFPNNKALIDRFNRLVGRHRQWLPPEGEKVPEQFWLHYEKAEKFDKDFRKAVAKARPTIWSSDPFHKMRFGYGDEKDLAQAQLAKAMSITLEQHGINIEAMLEQGDRMPQLPDLRNPSNHDLFAQAA